MRAKTRTLQKIRKEYYNDRYTTGWVFMPRVNGSHGQLKENKHQFASNTSKMQKKKKKKKKKKESSTTEMPLEAEG